MFPIPQHATKSSTCPMSTASCRRRMRRWPMADQTFRLPDLGEGLTEAQLVARRVEEGARVEVNAPLCDVETAKAVVVIPSRCAGTIQKLHARPGDSVAVGEPLVTITASDGAQADATPGTLVGYGPDAPESGIRRRPRTAATSSSESGADVRAAPFVRQLAKDRGADRAQLTGSGPAGRITKADVEAAAASPAAAASGSTTVPSTDGERRISGVGIAKAIARPLGRCVSPIPQFTEFAVFDATNLMAAREQRKASGRPMTPLPYFIAAVVKAVKAYPLT